MGFDLSSGSSTSRQRIPEALVPAQSLSPLTQRPISEKAPSEGEERKKVPPAILTPLEIQRVRERFEPLRPVLQAALDGLSKQGRELRDILAPPSSQVEGPSAPSSREQTPVHPDLFARALSDPVRGSIPGGSAIPGLSFESPLATLPSPVVTVPEKSGPVGDRLKEPVSLPQGHQEIRGVLEQGPAPSSDGNEGTGPGTRTTIPEGFPRTSTREAGVSRAPEEKKSSLGTRITSGSLSAPEPKTVPALSRNNEQPVLREEQSSIIEDAKSIEVDDVIGSLDPQRGPGFEPRPPQGIPVTGGLPVILPGQSQPAPSPEPIFGSGEDGRKRVGLPGGEVARVGNTQDEIREFQRRLRENEPTHLFMLSQEVVRFLGQASLTGSQQGSLVQTQDFQGEIFKSALPVRSGEMVAKSTIGGDNDRGQKTLLESVQRPADQLEKEDGTVGAPPEEPPLSSLERPEPPLPTNIRSRFVPVASVNILDLVL